MVGCQSFVALIYPRVDILIPCILVSAKFKRTWNNAMQHHHPDVFGASR